MNSSIAAIADRVARAVSAIYNVSVTEDVAVDLPPSIAMGDFAVACFAFAKICRTSPTQIARQVADFLGDDDLGTWTASGPYVNVRLRPQVLFAAAVRPLRPLAPSGRQIMVEYLSPNTNKPLHVGHARNGVTGMAVARLLAFVGHDVVKTAVINDRGVHICKSMLAWERWGQGATPETTGQKGDHFVGDYYVKFAQEEKRDPSLAAAAQDMLRKWEEGDAHVRAVWRTMNAWVEDGFRRTFADYGFLFDKVYHESDIYLDGKTMIDEGLHDGVIVRESSGAVVFPLDPNVFGADRDGGEKKMTLLRADGTALYATQDVALAARKSADYPSLSASVYVVGEEQEYYFATLFALLRAFGFPWAKTCYHLSYAMVNLPSGKMKSREGTVVDADDLRNDMCALVADDLRKRHGDVLSAAEIDQRATVLAMGAITFFLLKTKPKTVITFDMRQASAFEGMTGPYIQYAYTRAAGVARTAAAKGITPLAETWDAIAATPAERALAQQLIMLPSVIARAAHTYDPSVVAHAAYQLAQTFHSYYNDTPIVTDNVVASAQRLTLVSAVAAALQTTLGILGIGVLEEM